jgi:hypothetical protein
MLQYFNFNLEKNKLFFLEKSNSLYIPLILSAIFFVNLLWFNQYIYLVAIVTMVALIQLKPLSSKFTQNIVFFCFPVIGAIANYESVCLTYNSVILFLWCRTYATHQGILLKDILTYGLIIGTWLLYYDADINGTIYFGGIMHGFMHPLHYLFLWSRFKLIKWLVIIVPTWFMIDNIFKFEQYFVAFWDFEILSVYFLWLMGLEKEIVVKRVFLFSLPLITFCQIFWDICPK